MTAVDRMRRRHEGQLVRQVSHIFIGYMQRSVSFEGIHSQKESYFCPQTMKNKAVIGMNGCKEHDRKF